MKYKTIDFFINAEKHSAKDIAKAFLSINRQIQMYKNRLGDNFTEYFAADNKGVDKIQFIDCPFCNTVKKAFISSEVYSEDLCRRILQAKCITCQKLFAAYQEIDQQNKFS